jgi:hypothetical protein
MRFGFSLAGPLALALIAGCAPLPDLDSQVTPEAKAAPYPALIPLDAALEDASAVYSAPAAQSAQSARAAALRARAAQMRAAAGQ